MKNIFTLLATTAAISLMAPAYAADVSSDSKVKFEAKDNGGYQSESTSKSVTAGGTVKTIDKSLDMDIDSDGKASKTVKTKTVSDPDGLMNRSEKDVEVEIEEKANGGVEKTEVSEETNSDGTNVTTESNTDVDVDSDGTVNATVKTEKIIDPDGLMNKTKVNTETKMRNGVVVEQHKETN
jgi:opacity protein-like surface antigen